MNFRNFSAQCLAALAVASTTFATTPSASWSQSPPKSTECNCVFYARWRVPSLPSGLTPYSGKKAIINLKSSDTPRKNDVAIINSGSSYYDTKLRRTIVTGHVAVVDGAKNGIITISESNWGGCGFRTRNGTAKDLKIDGYFRPK